jgi:hypothetical protein
MQQYLHYPTCSCHGAYLTMDKNDFTLLKKIRNVSWWGLISDSGPSEGIATESIWTDMLKPQRTPIRMGSGSRFDTDGSVAHWASAAGRRIFVPTFVDREVSRGQRGGSPMVVNLSFLDRSRYFFFPVVAHLSLWGWVDPVPDPMRRRKFGKAENRTQELWPLYHRGGRYW